MSRDWLKAAILATSTIYSHFVALILRFTVWLSCWMMTIFIGSISLVVDIITWNVGFRTSVLTPSSPGLIASSKIIWSIPLASCSAFEVRISNFVIKPSIIERGLIAHGIGYFLHSYVSNLIFYSERSRSQSSFWFNLNLNLLILI